MVVSSQFSGFTFCPRGGATFLRKYMAMSPLIVDLAKNSFFTFFEKKVKPKNFKYYSS